MANKKTQYYLKEFQKINESKFSWNWCACLFNIYWMIYRKMYSSVCKLAAISIVVFLICFTFSDSYGHIAIIPAIITPFILGGFWGNRWYYSTIKHRIRNGYHLNEAYKATSVFFLLFQSLVPFIDKGIEKSGIYDHCYFFRLLGVAVLVIYWYKDKVAAEKITNKMKNFDNTVDDNNISKLV